MDISEIEIIKFLVLLYFINMIMFAFLYLYTMYNQYKNAHDKWYDIVRENDIDKIKKKERVKIE